MNPTTEKKPESRQSEKPARKPRPHDDIFLVVFGYSEDGKTIVPTKYQGTGAERTRLAKIVRVNVDGTVDLAFWTNIYWEAMFRVKHDPTASKTLTWHFKEENPDWK